MGSNKSKNAPFSAKKVELRVELGRKKVELIAYTVQSVTEIILRCIAMNYEPINWDKVPEVITKEQLWRLCHISKSTARFLLQSGKIPYIYRRENTVLQNSEKGCDGICRGPGGISRVLYGYKGLVFKKLKAIEFAPLYF